MPTVTIDERKLQELIKETVQKELKQTFEDMEDVRRSPAGAIIRVEARFDAVERRLDRDMVTRAEFQDAIMETRAEFKESITGLRLEMKDEAWKTKLYFIVLAGLIVLTNPKVLELFGKIFGIVK